ncbi:NSS family neurotransmitter:Na+ symporter [Stackebrandtia endophytica]|uniref:NSS family neurotransmitter:Na+ symporter n=1 Tax=Stackebrandtia endophytica TaxID=1496996 RepID=A0A543AXJ0_9ACTN|nr:sodium-dependent transporter [Stackebrandtia endophytica]TQL77294.1 NSS family neurotransmitter:Na+ symporter [Stackebrandtia endophytica]
MAQAREQWGTRAGFILAAVGSAIGLGNIWRFPDTAFKAGGGSFLVPYIIALLTAAIPLLIMEYAIGHKNRASPPLAFRRVSRSLQPIGWWQTAICVVIACYYATIIAWAIRYVFFALDQSWSGAPDTATFFTEFVGVEAAGETPSLVPGVAVPAILVWIATLVILGLGIRKGIEIASKIFIPLLIVVFGCLVVWSLTLEGAVDGLNAFFTPDWSRLFDTNVWLLVYGQLFFSLSVGFGIMVTYASYLRRRADLSGPALVAGFANSSFEILAGIGVFAALGFMAASQGTTVEQVVADGVGLAFFSFPTIISELPFGSVGNGLFGVLFFGSLVIAGFTSLVSIVQVVISTVQDRLGTGRWFTVAVVGVPMAVVSVGLFASTQGLNFLDVADHYINHYGIAAAAFVSLVIVAVLLRKLPQLRDHLNRYSSIKVGWWWFITLGVLTPIGLGAVLIHSLIGEFQNPYGEGEYSNAFLFWSGWVVAIGAFVFGIVMSLIPWRNADRIETESISKEGSA